MIIYYYYYCIIIIVIIIINSLLFDEEFCVTTVLSRRGQMHMAKATVRLSKKDTDEQLASF